jgi:hypothetical protein
MSEPRAESTRGVGPARRHVVLHGAEGAAYTSLRYRPIARARRYRIGRHLRRHVPRSLLGEWIERPGQAHPLEQIKACHEGRLEWLIPVRVGRMTASPYGFLRGSAIVMAAASLDCPPPGSCRSCAATPIWQLRLLRLAGA